MNRSSLAQPTRSLTDCFSDRWQDTSLKFYKKTDTDFKIVLSNFQPGIPIIFEILALLGMTDLFFFQNQIISHERTSQELLQKLL